MSVPQVPGPADDGALAGCRLVGKLDGRGRTAYLQVGREFGCRERVNRYIIRFYFGCGAAGVLGYQCNRVCPRGSIGNAGVLRTGDLSVTKIPGPESRVVSGQVLESDCQWTAASRCRGREVGYWYLGTKVDYPNKDANGAGNKLSYPDQKSVNFGH